MYTERPHRITCPRRLLRAACWVGILSRGEAMCAVTALRYGHSHAGEAVTHFGGPKAVLSSAARRDVRRIARNFPL